MGIKKVPGDKTSFNETETFAARLTGHLMYMYILV